MREVVHLLPVTIGRGHFERPRSPGTAPVSRATPGSSGRNRVTQVRGPGQPTSFHVGRPRELRLDERVRCLVGLVQIELEPVSEQPTLEIPARDWWRFDRRPELPAPARGISVGVTGLLVGGVIEPSFWSPKDETRWVDLLGMGLVVVVLLFVAGGVLFVALKALGRSAAAGSVTLSERVAAHLADPPANLAPPCGVLSAVPVRVGSGSQRRGGGHHPGGASRDALDRRHRAHLGGGDPPLRGGGILLLALEARQTGEPQVETPKVQVPLGGHAGRADSFQGYLGDVRKLRSAGWSKPRRTCEGNETGTDPPPFRPVGGERAS